MDGDARDADAVLAGVSAGVDLSAPACLIMAALLHFFPVETGRELVARYAAALAPGSYVMLTMGLADGAAADRFFDLYSKGPAPLYKHSAEDFASFFGDPPAAPARCGGREILASWLANGVGTARARGRDDRRRGPSPLGAVRAVPGTG